MADRPSANDNWPLSMDDLRRPPRDCGCGPCRGQCRSQATIRALWCEEMAEDLLERGAAHG